MNKIKYINLEQLNKKELLNILNKDKIRKHLVSHAQFDEHSLQKWIESKIEVNATAGCKIRGVSVNGAVAGWCGIQLENEAYELATVLDEAYWGIGLEVFKQMMEWAAEMGHGKVALHLFNTRPEYEFLTKMASRVYESTLFGQTYTTYELTVPKID